MLHVPAIDTTHADLFSSAASCAGFVCFRFQMSSALLPKNARRELQEERKEARKQAMWRPETNVTDYNTYTDIYKMASRNRRGKSEKQLRLK